MKVSRRPKHRPISSISRTLDAACLYRELRRRGLSERGSADAVKKLLGTSRSSLQKYQDHPIQSPSEEDDRRDAGYALSKYWGMAKLHWFWLTDPEKAVIRPLVPRLLQDDPPPET